MAPPVYLWMGWLDRLESFYPYAYGVGACLGVSALRDVFRYLVGALGCWSLGFIALAQSDPVERFAALPEYSSMDLSPDGQFIVYLSGHRQLDRAIVIAGVEPGLPVVERHPITSIPVPPSYQLRDGRIYDEVFSEVPRFRRLERVRWLDDEHLLIEIGVVGGSTTRDRRIHTTISIVHRIRDGVRVLLPRGVELVAPLPSDPSRALFAQYTDRIGGRRARCCGMAQLYDLQFEPLDWSLNRNLRNNHEPRGSFALLPDGRRGATLLSDEMLFTLYSPASREPRGRVRQERFSIDDEFRFEGRHWSQWSGVVDTLLGMDVDQRHAYFRSRRDPVSGDHLAGRRYAVFRIDLEDGEIGGPVFSSDQVDVAAVLLDWRDNSVIGADIVEPLSRRVYLSNQFALLQSELDAKFGAERVIPVDWSLDLERVLVGASLPGQPLVYAFYDRTSETIVPIGSEYSADAQRPFGKLRVVNYVTRDGMAQYGYLTLPRGALAEPRPVIVVPHGGPAARDTDDFDPLVHFLIANGYAVFQPQFRGSAGFGLDFEEAGERQWAGSMQTDIYDGLDALGSTGLVDPDRACIVGWSYGGYAALVSATDGSDLFRCTVSIAGVSDVRELVDRDGARARGQERLYWARVIGDWRSWGQTEEQISPLFRAGLVERPLLLIHGTDDEVVPYQQSVAFFDASATAPGSDIAILPLDGARHSFHSMTVDNRTEMLRSLSSFLREHNPVEPLDPIEPRPVTMTVDPPVSRPWNQ
jgi:dienelactone hydrolase